MNENAAETKEAKGSSKSNGQRWSEELKRQVGTLRERLKDNLDQLEERVQELTKDNSALAKAKKLRDDLDRQLNETHEQLLGALGLASRRELDKLNRKVNSLNRKLADQGKAA